MSPLLWDREADIFAVSLSPDTVTGRYLQVFFLQVIREGI